MTAVSSRGFRLFSSALLAVTVAAVVPSQVWAADVDGDGVESTATFWCAVADPNDADANSPVVGGAGDTDSDGLTNAFEASCVGTNAAAADSDSDGVSDFVEVFTHGTDPNDNASVALSYFYDFEADAQGWTGTFGRTNISSGGTAFPSFTFGSPGDVVGSAQNNDGFSPSLDLSFYAVDPVLTFDYWTNNEGSLTFDCENVLQSGDGVGYALLTGACLNQIANDNTWRNASFAMSGLAGDNSAFVRFNFNTVDGCCGNDGWYVDNVAIAPNTVLDTDSDGIRDIMEINSVGSDPADADSDGDGLSDGIELYTTFTDPNNSADPGMANDWDADGLDNVDEYYLYGTDPLSDADLDGDTIDDNEEILVFGTLHNDSDTDNDGLGDGFEQAYSDGNQNTYVPGADLNPNDDDTDNDGLLDGIEEANANGVVDAGETDPLDDDSDNDGLLDGTEDANANGLVDAGETDPLDDDSDNDGLLDGTEDANANGVVDAGETDPLDSDSDNDGLLDGTEDANGNGAVNAGETDPLDADTDADGVQDGTEDANANGTVDATETDPLDDDSDNDGLLDGTEDANGNGAVNAGETNPLDDDSDDDGLLDGTEDANANGAVNAGETNPLDDDSDNDGVQDGTEQGLTVAQGSDTGASFVADADNATTTLPLDSDSDNDGLLDGTDEDVNGNGQVNATETNPNNVDTDGDGLCDGALTVGACDGAEATRNTDPLLVDTDSDTLCDGQDTVGACLSNEVARGTDPLDSDTDLDGLSDAAANDLHPLDNDFDNDGLLDGTDSTLGCYANSNCDNDGLIDGKEYGNDVALTGGTSTNGIAFTGTGGVYSGDTDTGSTTLVADNDTDNDNATDGREDTDKDGNFDGRPAEGDPNLADTFTIGGVVSGLPGGESITVRLESPVGTVRETLVLGNGAYTFSALDAVVIDGQDYRVTLSAGPFSTPGGLALCGVMNSTGTPAGNVANANVDCGAIVQLWVNSHIPDPASYPNYTLYITSDNFPLQTATASDGGLNWFLLNEFSTFSITASVTGDPSFDTCLFQNGTESQFVGVGPYAGGANLTIHHTCGAGTDLSVDVVNALDGAQQTQISLLTVSPFVTHADQTIGDGDAPAQFKLVQGMDYSLPHVLQAGAAQTCALERDNAPVQTWDGTNFDTSDDTWGLSAINAVLTCDETEIYSTVLDLVPGSLDADITLHSSASKWDSVRIVDPMSGNGRVNEADNSTSLLQIPLVPAGLSYFTTAHGSVCTVRYDGLVSYVTCGYEYEIGGKVFGGIADTVTLSLTSSNDSTVHYTTIPTNNPGGEGFNFAPATYVVQGSQWEVLVDTQPTAPNFCSVSGGTGVATGNTSSPMLLTGTTVTCGLLRTITVEVTAQTGFDVDIALASSLGATQIQNNIVDGGSATFSVVDGAVIDVTVADYNNHSAYCTVVGGTAVAAAGDLTVYINCGPTYTILGGAISNLTGSGLELRETNTGASAVAVGGSYVFPAGILQTGAAYDVVIARQPTAPEQVCTLSGTTNGTVANQNVQGPDVVCTPVSPWYSLSVNVSGLAGDRVRLIEAASGQVTNVTASGVVTFATDLTNGTYTVQVDAQPQGPAQVCSFGVSGTASETVTISNADQTVNLTCVTTTYNVAALIAGKDGNASNLVLDFNGVLYNVAGDGQLDFGTLAQGAPYAVSVDTQPALPAQSCVVNGGLGVMAAAAVSNITVDCVDDLFTVAVDVSGLATGSSLLLSNNGDPMIVEGDGLWAFPMSLTGVGIYDVQILDDMSFQTCNLSGVTSGNLADADAVVTITCAADTTYSLTVNVTGLAGDRVRLIETTTGAVTNVVTDGPVTFATDLTNGTYTVQVDVQPTAPAQVCTFNNTGTGTETVSINNAAASINLTCATNVYAVQATVSGLKSASTIDLSLNSITFTTTGNGAVNLGSMAAGMAYDVAVAAVPAGESCVVTEGASGVMTTNGINNVVVVCQPVTGYSLSVNVSGLAGDRVRLIEVASGQVTNVTASGVVTFATDLTNGTYTVQVDVQPTAPAQTCSFGGSSSATVVIANADQSVNLTCTTTTYAVSALVQGKDGLADDLVLNYNGVTYAVTMDTQVAFGSEIQGAPYLVTVETQPALPAQTCTVDGGLGTVGTAPVSDVAVTCTDNLYSVYANVGGLALGSSLLLSNNGDPMVVEGDGLWAFPSSLTGVGYYDVVMLDDTSFQTCVVSSSPSAGYLADASTTVDIVCTTDPRYTISVNVSGLNVDPVRLIEVATGQVTNVTADALVTFADDLTNGTYTVQVDVNPATPAQSCTFDNTGTAAETVVIANADVTVNLTCVNNLYSVWMTVNGLTGDQVDVDFGSYQGDSSTMTATGDGIYTIGNYADQTTFAASVTRQPVLPAQTCTVTPDLFLVDAGTPSGLTVNCVDDLFTVSANVSGLALGSSLLLSNNGDPMIVTGDGVWPFSMQLGGVDAYDVQVVDDTSFQTCVVSSAPSAGNLADADVTVDITCTDDPFYAITVNVAGLAGDRVRLIETTTGAVTNVVADGPVTFATDLTNGAYTVQVDAQPNREDNAGSHQQCLFDNGTTSRTVSIANGNQSISLTCTAVTYTVSGTLRGLLGGNSITLTNNGGDALLLAANGVFTFATPLTEGALYNVRVSVLPTNQVCTVYGRSGVIGQSAANSVEVVCSPLDYDGDGLTDHDELEVWGTATDSTDTDGDLLSDYAEAITHQTNPTHVDTDGDGAQDNWELAGYGAGVTTDPRRVDSDLDGLTDGDEIAYGGNVSVYTAGLDLNPTDPDTDNGGIWDGAEIVDTLDTPTNPLVASDDRLDSDGDGISDYAEINGTLGYVTNHLEADDDNDGLSDSEEILGYGTWATDSDSDNDGLGDAIEVETYGTDPLDVDSDDDTLWDNAEVLVLATNPLTSDTDHDGAADNFELSGYSGGVTTDPLRWDSDLDGLSDGFEVGYDGDASVYTAGADLNPTDVDTDDGGIWDGAELVDSIDPQTDPLDASDDRLDTDNDGVSDYDEINGTFSVGGYATNHRDADSDHDGLSDGVELLGYASFATDADSDNDGLDDAVEVYTYHTDLLDADSDDDMLTDGDEVLLHHTQPNDADTDNDGLRDDTEVLLLSTDPAKLDSDADDVTDYAEVNVDGNSLNYTIGADTNPNKADTDNDGLGDGYERDQGTNPNSVDSDNDGLTDRRELTNTDTNPLVVDTDGDTLGDGAEQITHHTDPLSTDTDLDGVRDDAELTIGTSPVRADTDGDGATDGFELSWANGARNGNPNVFNGNDMDPLKVDTDDGGIWDGAEVLSNYLATDPLDRDDDRFDADHDGITDWDEVNGVLADPTDPYDPDTDDDGVNDGVEVFSYRSDPTDRDTDDDRLLDGEEVDDYGTDVTVADSDGDTLVDGQEVLDEGTDPRRADTDRDGLRDDEELVEGEDGYITDPLRADTDSDSLIDGDEFARATNPLHQDSDGDNVKDGDEVYIYETDPAKADTDADGIDDGKELMQYRTDPLDADSDDDGDVDGKEVKDLRTDPLDNDKDAIASGGAGGCSVADRATANNSNLLPILLVALLVALRRRQVRLRPAMLTALLAVVALVLAIQPAQARQLSFPPHNTQTFYLADDVGEYFVTRDSRTRRQLGFQASLGFNYSKEMLVVREADKVKRIVIDRLLTEDTALSFGIIDQLQLDVSVPYHVYVERGKVQNTETYKSNWWGDIRAGLKGRILDRMEYPVGLAVRAFVYAPTGREDQFLGAKAIEYGAQAIIDHDFGFMKLAGNLGWVGRESQKAPGSDIDDQLTWSVASDLAMAEHFGLIVDVFGATLLKDFFGAEYGSPIEGAIGGRYWLDNGFTMSAGIGRGINSGAGAPPMRMNWTLAYQLPNDRDRDMDGFSDELDACAGRAEDIDGYKDGDGCPDGDHDEDGVLDTADACPAVAEDRDGHEDRDGCPEFDNDGDGILDEVDRCPNDKETVNGYADGDGCPDAERISVVATIIDDESGAKLAGEISIDPKVGKVRFEKGAWRGDLPEPGVYTFKFKVQGYEDVFRKFQVTAGQKLNMEIRMLMAESDDEVPSAPKTQPAPAPKPEAAPAPAEPATVQPEAN